MSIKGGKRIPRRCDKDNDSAARFWTQGSWSPTWPLVRWFTGHVLSPMKLDFLILTPVYLLSAGVWTQGVRRLPTIRWGRGRFLTMSQLEVPDWTPEHTSSQISTHAHVHKATVERRRKGRRRAGPIFEPPCLASRLPVFPPVWNMHGNGWQEGHSSNRTSSCAFLLSKYKLDYLIDTNAWYHSYFRIFW